MLGLKKISGTTEIATGKATNLSVSRQMNNLVSHSFQHFVILCERQISFGRVSWRIAALSVIGKEYPGLSLDLTEHPTQAKRAEVCEKQHFNELDSSYTQRWRS